MANMYSRSDVVQIKEENEPKIELTGCNVCGQNHSTESCPFLSEQQPVQDSKTPSRARLTLPANLEVQNQSDGTTGVIARAPFARGTRFGPFQAGKTSVLPVEIQFPLKVFGKTDDDSYYLDTTDEEACNWMCLVSPVASSTDNQNLICYQMNQDIYYTVMRDILPGEELRVWYAPYYAVKMGSMPFSIDFTSSEIPTLIPEPKKENNSEDEGCVEETSQDLDSDHVYERKRKRKHRHKYKYKKNREKEREKSNSNNMLIDQQVTQRVAEQLPARLLGARFEPDKWQCRECGMEITSVIEYAQHLMGHFKPLASNIDKPSRCHICRKKFLSEMLLVKHKVIQHNIMVQRPRLLLNVGEVEGDSPSSESESSENSDEDGESQPVTSEGKVRSATSDKEKCVPLPGKGTAQSKASDDEHSLPASTQAKQMVVSTSIGSDAGCSHLSENMVLVNSSQAEWNSTTSPMNKGVVSSVADKMVLVNSSQQVQCCVTESIEVPRSSAGSTPILSKADVSSLVDKMVVVNSSQIQWCVTKSNSPIALVSTMVMSKGDVSCVADKVEVVNSSQMQCCATGSNTPAAVNPSLVMSKTDVACLTDETALHWCLGKSNTVSKSPIVIDTTPIFSKADASSVVDKTVLVNSSQMQWCVSEGITPAVMESASVMNKVKSALVNPSEVQWCVSNSNGADATPIFSKADASSLVGKTVLVNSSQMQCCATGSNTPAAMNPSLVTSKTSDACLTDETALQWCVGKSNTVSKSLTVMDTTPIFSKADASVVDKTVLVNTSQMQWCVSESNVISGSPMVASTMPWCSNKMNMPNVSQAIPTSQVATIPSGNLVMATDPHTSRTSLPLKWDTANIPQVGGNVQIPATTSASKLDWCMSKESISVEKMISDMTGISLVGAGSPATLPWCPDKSTSIDSSSLIGEQVSVSASPRIDWCTDEGNVSLSREAHTPVSSVNLQTSWCSEKGNVLIDTIANSRTNTSLVQTRPPLISPLPSQMDWCTDETSITGNISVDPKSISLCKGPILSTPVPQGSWLTDETTIPGSNSALPQIEEPTVVLQSSWRPGKAINSVGNVLSSPSDLVLLERIQPLPSQMNWHTDDTSQTDCTVTRGRTDVTLATHSCMPPSTPSKLDWHTEDTNLSDSRSSARSPQVPASDSSLWQTEETSLPGPGQHVALPLPSPLDLPWCKTTPLSGSSRLGEKSMSSIIHDDDTLMNYVMPELDRPSNQGAHTESGSSETRSESAVGGDVDLINVEDQVARLHSGDELVFITNAGELLLNTAVDQDGRKVAINTLLEQLQQSAEADSLPTNDSEPSVLKDILDEYVSPPNSNDNLSQISEVQDEQFIVIPVAEDAQEDVIEKTLFINTTRKGLTEGKGGEINGHKMSKTVLSQKVFTKLAGDTVIEDVKNLLSEGYSLQFLVEQEDGSTTLVDIMTGNQDAGEKSDFEQSPVMKPDDVSPSSNSQVMVSFDVNGVPVLTNSTPAETEVASYNLNDSFVHNVTIPDTNPSFNSLQIVPDVCSETPGNNAESCMVIGENYGINGLGLSWNLTSNTNKLPMLSVPSAVQNSEVLNLNEDAVKLCRTLVPENTATESGFNTVCENSASFILDSLQSDKMIVSNNTIEEGRMNFMSMSQDNMNFNMNVPLTLELGKQIDNDKSFIKNGSERTQNGEVKDDCMTSSQNNALNERKQQLMLECKNHLTSISVPDNSLSFDFEPSINKGTCVKEEFRPSIETGGNAVDSVGPNDCSDVPFQAEERNLNDIVMTQQEKDLTAETGFVDFVGVGTDSNGCELKNQSNPDITTMQSNSNAVEMHLNGLVMASSACESGDPNAAKEQSPQQDPEDNAVGEADLPLEGNDPKPARLAMRDVGPPYNCDICSKEFLKANYLYRHLRKHTGEFTCVSCHAVFARKESLLIHSCFANNQGKTVTCAYCQKAFTNKKLLTRHLDIHTGKWSCKHCNRVFSSKNVLELHLSKFHVTDNECVPPNQCRLCGQELVGAKRRHKCTRNNSKKCTYCGRVLGLQDDALQAHEQLCQVDKSAFGGKVAICPICGANFKQLVNFRFHVYKHTHAHLCVHCNRSFRSEKEKFSHVCLQKWDECLLCPRHFTSVHLLEKHNISHGIPEFHCYECGHSFHRQDGLNNHRCFELDNKSALLDQKKKHRRKKPKSLEEEATTKSSLVCDVCGEVYKTPHSLRAHRFLHGERRFECPVCHKKFHRKDVLQEHLYVHQKAQIPCPVCNKKLKSKKSVDVHMLQHTGKKRYSCHVCGKEFFQKVNLRKHSHLHNPRPEPMLCPHCPKKFTSQDYLSKHILEHTQGRIFQCTQCDKAFVKGYLLQAHVRMHHTDQSFMCSICGHLFKYRNSLQRHMEKRHSEFRDQTDTEPVGPAVTADSTQEGAEVLLTVSELQLTTEGVQLQGSQLYDSPVATVAEGSTYILEDGTLVRPQENNLQDMVLYVLEPIDNQESLPVV